jgi:hypothetical protein
MDDLEEKLGSFPRRLPDPEMYASLDAYEEEMYKDRETP